MAAPPKPVAGDEVCPICNRPRSEHAPKEMLECSRQIAERSSLRHCGTCGPTMPEDSMHDRCGKCGEEYAPAG